jgi:hypothetical protein
VQAADAQALYARPYGPIATVLAPNGDAYLAFPRIGGEIQVLVRRAWTGRWTPLPVFGSATAVTSFVPVITLSANARTLDILWLDRTSPPGSSLGYTIRSARLDGVTWQPLTAGGVPGVGSFVTAAMGAGGAAVVAGATTENRIVATTRSSSGAGWNAPAELATVAGSVAAVPILDLGAAAGRDASLLATWIGLPVGASAVHGFVARRRPGAATWDAPADLGLAADLAPSATTNRRGDLAVVWAELPSPLDEGPGPLLLARQPAGGVLSAPVRVAALGGSAPYLADDGALVLATFRGLNTATFGSSLLSQERPGAAVRAWAGFGGSTRAFAAGGRSALLVSSAPEEFGAASYVGMDRLGPLGLEPPAAARAGGAVSVRLNLWRRTRVTVRLRGGRARASVTRILPTGRSVVRLRLPDAPGAYLVDASGREVSGTRSSTQRAVVHAR